MYGTANDRMDNDDLVEFDPVKPLRVEDIIQNLFNALFCDNDYGSEDYWNERYSSEETKYEWFLNWPEFFSAIRPNIDIVYGDVLHIGCGNSEMSFDILENGFSSVSSIDISAVVIDQMKKKYADNQKLSWFTQDCRKLEFVDSSFDFVVEKGTIDAIYCSSDPEENIGKTMSEISRVMKEGACFISMSFADIELRKSFIEISSKFLHFSKNLTVSQFYVYIFFKKVTKE